MYQGQSASKDNGMSRWRSPGWLLIVGGCFALPLSAVSQEVLPDKTLLRAADHVLVWSQNENAGERIFESMGFNVRKGQDYPEGIGSSTIAFEDWSYVELLRFTDPARAAGNAQAMAELEFARQAPGANSFAIQVSDVNQAAAFLKGKGFAVADIVPDIVDPDGPTGPEPPKLASWRDFHFAEPTVSGVEIFFIEYSTELLSTDGANAPSNFRNAHPNSARRLSAVWVLVDDVDYEAEVYGRMGFSVGAVSRVDLLNAQIRVASLGDGAVVLVQATSLPDEFVLPGRPGPRVIGLSFEVDSLDRAKAAESDMTDVKRHDYRGPFGPSRLSQLMQIAGFFVEFHEREAQ